MNNLDPKILNAADVRQVHHLLTTNKNSDELDHLFKKWHYPARILIQLRQEIFSVSNNETIGKFIKTLLDVYHREEVKRDILKPFRHMLANSDISLGMRCYLICRPSLVAAFEHLNHLKRTGNLASCIENYQGNRYTNLAMQIPQFVRSDLLIIKAARYGHTQLISEYLNERGTRVGTESKVKALIKALKYGHEDTAAILKQSFMSDMGGLISIYMRAGRIQEVNSMLETTNVSEPFWALNAGRSGNIQLVKIALSLLPNDDDKYSNCLDGAIAGGHIHVFDYIQSLNVFNVDLYIAEYTSGVNKPLHMLQFLLSRGAEHPNIFMGMREHVQHPDFIPILTKCIHLISLHSLVTFLSIAMYLYDYELFKTLTSVIGDRMYQIYFNGLLRATIQSNSRLFFDTIYSFRGNTILEEATIEDSIRPSVQSHIFDTIFRHPQMEKSTQKTSYVLRAMREDDIDKFYTLFYRFEADLNLKYLCREAHRQLYHRYFRFLFKDKLCSDGDMGRATGLLIDFGFPVACLKNFNKTMKVIYEMGLYHRLLDILFNAQYVGSVSRVKCIYKLHDRRLMYKFVKRMIKDPKVDIAATLATGYVPADILARVVKVCQFKSRLPGYEHVSGRISDANIGQK